MDGRRIANYKLNQIGNMYLHMYIQRVLRYVRVRSMICAQYGVSHIYVCMQNHAT